MTRIALSRSQQNIYTGVLQNEDPALYLIGKSYRFRPRELSDFLAALAGAIAGSPAHLCVLEAAPTGEGYPDLVPRLRTGDIVRVRPAMDGASDSGGAELANRWASGLLGKPLARYTVRTDARGRVCGLEAHAHHVLFDGGATGIIEEDLARRLGGADQAPQVAAGLAALAAAHRSESARADEAARRLDAAVRREIADAIAGDGGQDAPATAAKGALIGSAQISGEAYEAILALAEAEQKPLNILVAAAAVAVDAGLRQSTAGLLVHAVDNRFADPVLNVATCLVNSVAHPIRFPPFASARDVVGALDRQYVAAVRRRWFREERYRRMYLAVNRTSRLDALTLNFIREPCAPGLRPFLSEPPVATEIGPVEGMTVACVLDEARGALSLSVWNRADLPEGAAAMVAERIAAALESMPTRWLQPIATSVGEWFEIGPDGARGAGETAEMTAQETGRGSAPAWFLDPECDMRGSLERRRHVLPWVAWLIQRAVAPGEVVVLADDDTDKTIDLLVACHLAGCGYSVCAAPDEMPARAAAIAAHGTGAHLVDVAAARLATDLDGEPRELVDRRMAQVARGSETAAATAYVMATSGSTGQPKLVRISHGSLALFCRAARGAYGWTRQDVILQSAPLTSDISVEEIFVGASCGAELVRSASVKTGDLTALARDLVAAGPTLLDLPTSVWHLLCEDGAALAAIRRSRVRQIVVGGEAIRPSAVEKWLCSEAAQAVSLLSTYGPTETTVVVTALPVGGPTDAGAPARLRLGRPLVPRTVFAAFGEVVIVGDAVSAGYLGIESPSFGFVATGGGTPRRAFATADRVAFDQEGFAVLGGRRDAIVKISGKRVDVAEVVRRVCADPCVSDVAVEAQDGSLGVWLQTGEGSEEAEAAARARGVLVGLGVSSFFVVGVPNIPRKPNGKIDSAELRAISRPVAAPPRADGAEETATGLAQLWSRRLGTAIGPDSSLLAEGVGSLDLMRILPDTRQYLARQLSILDLIRADTAARLVADVGSATDGLLDADTAAEIERDLISLRARPAAPGSHPPPSGEQGAILVLGASGILGTGFAEAVLDLRRSGTLCPEVVLVARSQLPTRAPWTALRNAAGVRIERLSGGLGPTELAALIRASGARTVVNCVGNTNVLAPYRALRLANVEPVAAMVEVCADLGARLAHLSTFVVNADVAAPQVTDPREAAYPYAASKALAELVVAGAPPGLDFTLVRLPRVLGTADQTRESADVLVSVVAACAAIRAYPSVSLTEEVTTGRDAARAILGLLPEFSGSTGLGRGVTVLRGAQVAYAQLLGQHAPEELDLPEWKLRLDESDWAKRNPGRWAVIDAWVGLGLLLGSRSYADYLADYPTIGLGLESVGELAAPPSRPLDFGGELSAAPPRLVVQTGTSY